MVKSKVYEIISIWEKLFRFAAIFRSQGRIKAGLMGLQPQAQAKIGSSLYQVYEVIKVTDAITSKNSEGVI